MSKTAAKIYIEPKFHFHPKYKEIYQKVQQALVDFPEVKEVTLSAFYPKSNNKWEAHDVMAIAGFGGTIEFNVKRMPSYNVIYHELFHIVQGKRKSTPQKTKKTFELEATLLGLARLPKSKVETNEMPYFTNVPKSKLVAYAKTAKSEKEKGNSNYMKVLTDKAKSDYAKDKNNKSRVKQWQRVGRSMPDPKHSVKFTEKEDGKNYAKGQTYTEVNNYLKTNIRKSQQAIVSKLIKPHDDKNQYAYEKADLITVPDWMKSDKSVKKSTAIKSTPKKTTTSKTVKSTSIPTKKSSKRA